MSFKSKLPLEMDFELKMQHNKDSVHYDFGLHK